MENKISPAAFKEGDRVTIAMRTSKENNRGGWHPKMDDCMDNIGVVKTVVVDAPCAASGYPTIRYYHVAFLHGSFNRLWWFSYENLRKAPV